MGTELKKVNRIDSIDPGKWMTTPFKETDEGFLTGRAIVTSVGVFSYRNADGSVTKELRLPKEVFNKDSLDSMKGKPVSNDHPEERITAANAKVYQVGNLGSNPSEWVDGWAALNDEAIPSRGNVYSDGFHIAIDLTITDADAIADVKAGKTALSCGYTCDYEPAEAGATWCGIAYDGIQRNIRYNHCAIVDVARAGDAARIRMDSSDAVQIYQSGVNQKTNSEDKSMGMKSIRLDGVEYQGEEGLINAYQAQKKRGDDAESALEKVEEDLEKLSKEISKLQGELDDKKDRSDKLEAEMKDLKEKSTDPKRLDEAVNAKLVLIDAAARAGVEIKADMADIDIKKAVITAVYPNVKFDGKDEIYINARFDAALEDIETLADGQSREVLSDSLPTAGKEDRKDSGDSRQKMINRMLARSRGDRSTEV